MTKVTAILTAFSTAMTIYITWASWHLDARIKLANADLQRAVEARTKRQAEENFNLQVYEKVWTALQDAEERKHNVAYALVQSLEDENVLKRHLLALFETPAVAQKTRQAAVVAIFQIDQQAVLRDAAARDGGQADTKVNYDVF